MNGQTDGWMEAWMDGHMEEISITVVIFYVYGDLAPVSW